MNFLCFLFSRSCIMYPPGDSHFLAEVFWNHGLIRLAVRTCETAPWRCGEAVANRADCLEASGVDVSLFQKCMDCIK